MQKHRPRCLLNALMRSPGSGIGPAMNLDSPVDTL